jgi:methionine sulfoxide reductase heme-binding subunit
MHRRQRFFIITLSVLAAVALVGTFQPRHIAYALPTANAGDIIVQTIPGPTLAQKLGQRVQQSWPWYITRASGFVAAAALFMLMLSGIGQVTGFMYRILEPLTSWASHRALGIVFGIAVLVHVLALLFDHYVPFNLLQILVPWTSGYMPLTLFGVNLGSAFVALGILALYLTILVVVTSLVWVDKKPYTWKLLHLASYLIVAFVFIHALYLGTDLAGGVLRWLWLGLGVTIIIATVHRLRRAFTT